MWPLLALPETLQRRPCHTPRGTVSRWSFILLSLPAVTAAPSQAQFWERMSNPTVPTQITHPPGLGLQISRVAFGPANGEGADEFVDALTGHFVQRDIEVIERERIEELLREHNFSLSGYVDRESAATIGKIVGPSVMVFVNMQRRAVEKKALYKDWRGRDGVVHRRYISRTQVFARGSIRSVDLATARVFAATVLEVSPAIENSADDRCCVEFPSEYELLDAANRDLAGQAARLFLPWQERVDLVYFDDSDCGLKAAHTRQKLGDVEGALQQSMSALEQCRQMSPPPKPKTLAHANHNVGMGHFALGQYDRALEFLEEAQRVRPAGIHAEAIVQVRRADTLATEMRRQEDRAALVEQGRQQASRSATAAVLTNKDVLEMVGAALAPDLITSRIRLTACRFDTSTSALIELKNSKVPDAVIIAMLERSKQ